MKKSLAELTQEIETLEAKIDTLTKEQKAFIEIWCRAVARIHEAPSIPSYRHYSARQVLDYIECYFYSANVMINSESEQRYYYEEKIEVLQKIETKGLDALEQYQSMVKSLKSHINDELQNPTWNDWGGDYAARKAAKWVREWKQQFLSN